MRRLKKDMGGREGEREGGREGRGRLEAEEGARPMGVSKKESRRKDIPTPAVLTRGRSHTASSLSLSLSVSGAAVTPLTQWEVGRRRRSSAEDGRPVSDVECEWWVDVSGTGGVCLTVSDDREEGYIR
jgi:hypothetical protein